MDLNNWMKLSRYHNQSTSMKYKNVDRIKFFYLKTIVKLIKFIKNVFNFMNFFSNNF